MLSEVRRDDEMRTGDQVNLKRVEETHPGDQMVGTTFQQLHVSDSLFNLLLIFPSWSPLADKHGSSVIVGLTRFCDGLGKPSFPQSVAVLTVKVMGTFCNFDGFSEDVGKVGPDIGYGFYSVEADAVFCLR